MIVLAKKEEIPEILSITKACAKEMIAKGILQWNEHYPSKNAFLIDIARGELYVYKKENTIIGCIVLSSFMDTEYEPVIWLSPNDNNLYIHRLAIHPDHQSKGYARLLMDYAEAFAPACGKGRPACQSGRKAKKCISLRLDTFSENLKNQQFYEQRGYIRLGNIYFPKQSEYPFYCYELLL